ncbi:MAG: 4-alpha-glucanotransferase [Woeseiaceae bacterium]|nr:4-alpha-glucanotransferase [Woeseiaceae bacterium]
MRKTCLPDNVAGIGLHVSALPGPCGIGEIGLHARWFVDRLCDAGLAVWQFLPVGPTGYGDSPYQLLSTFAGNEMLIDIHDLAERRLLDPDAAAALTALPAGQVDFARLIPRKQQLLAAAAERFVQNADRELRLGFDAFLQANDASWLHDYALYRVAKSDHDQRPWTDWPPGPGRTRARGVAGAAGRHRRPYRAHQDSPVPVLPAMATTAPARAGPWRGALW